MKCEDLWKWIETGNFAQRLLARRHAAKCPSCARWLAHLGRARRELARAEPLSRAERRPWERASQVDAARPGVSAVRVAVLAGAGVAAISILIALAWTAWQWNAGGPVEVVSHGRTPVSQPTGSQTIDDEAVRQIRQMKSQLLALSEELEELSRRAAMLDERKQVDQLLLEYEGP